VNYTFKRYLSDAVETTEVRGKRGICYWLNGTPVSFEDTEGGIHHTPAGIVSDGFSIPKFIWKMFFLILSAIDSRIPGYVHDVEYWLQYLEKEQADMNIYLGICWLALGQKWHKRFLIRTAAKIIWAGLKVGGSVAWNKYRRELEELGHDKVIQMHTAKTVEEAKVIANRRVV